MYEGSQAPNTTAMQYYGKGNKYKSKALQYLKQEECKSSHQHHQQIIILIYMKLQTA